MKDEEIEALIEKIKSYWINFALHSGSKIADLESLRGYVDWLYELNGYNPPKDIYIVHSPRELKQKTAELLGHDVPSDHSSRGLTQDGGWTAFYEFYEHVGVDQGQDFKTWIEFLKCGVWDSIFCDEAAIICTRPQAVHLDDEGRLHNTTGPAVEWANGDKYYLITGITVPKEWVEDPSSITAKTILEQRNVELRRILLSLKGLEAFAKEANSEVIDQDIDGGGEPRRLLRIPQRDDEDIYLLHYSDASQNKEGFLRVPPTMRTCHEAVAWTFGVEPDLYRPEVEA